MLFARCCLSTSINSLTSTQPLTISGGTLSIAATSTIGNTLSIFGGTLTSAGDVSVGGLVILNGGARSPALSTLNANGGMLINPSSNPSSSPSLLTAAQSTTPPARRRHGSGDNDVQGVGRQRLQEPGERSLLSGGGAGRYAVWGVIPLSFVNEGSFNSCLLSATTEAWAVALPFNVPGGSVDIHDR